METDSPGVPTPSLPDPTLSARVVDVRPLHYSGGADPAADLPDQVRSGSALVPLPDGRVVVVQDDVYALALVDPSSGTVEPHLLPPGPGGLRRFDDLRGNKALKLDLEAGVLVPGDRAPPGWGTVLLAFGSGSLPPREVVVVTNGWDRGPLESRVIAAPALYARLRDTPAFAGSELNLEGVLLDGEDLVVLNRGNGAARGGLEPTDALARLGLVTLLAHLQDPAATTPPELRGVEGWTLGEVNGVRLTFTDAMSVEGGLLYIAAAEDTPDAVRDGPVLGCAVGIIRRGRGRWTRVEEGIGWCTAKIEGVAPDPTAPGHILAVTDPDHLDEPAALLRIRLDGPWGDEGKEGE